MTEEQRIIYERCRRDGVFSIERYQGVNTLEPCHRELINAVWRFPRVAARACHGIGKTYTMARIVLAFGSAFPYSKILTTAPTGRQVSALLWSEIRKGYNKSKYPLGGQILETPNWKIDDDWFAMGFSPEKKPQKGEGQGAASAFQGFHAPYMLIIFDEATGIPKSIWTQAEGMLTSGFVRFVAIGNPTTKNCEFARCFSSKLWHKLHLSCFDSPNLKANGFYTKDDLRREIDRLHAVSEEEAIHTVANYKIVSPPLITAQWAVERTMHWGFDHPLTDSKVFGDFPDEDDYAFFPMDQIEAAQAREYEVRDTDERYVGVDPARFGGDSTVITVIEGWKVTKKIQIRGKDTMQVANRLTYLLNTLKRRPREVVLIDSTGIGAGVFDKMKENKSFGLVPKSIDLKEIQFGESAADANDKLKKQEKDKKQYYNLKAKIINLMAKDLKRFDLPGDDIYIEEMPTIIYEYDNKGRLKVESKDEYKKRTMRDSPDTSESLAIGNYGRHIRTKEARIKRARATAL